MFAAALALGFLAQELVVRAVVLSPEVPDFFRLAYWKPVLKGEAPVPDTLSRRALWWWSQPDGASFVRYTNRFGFRDREWRVTKGGRPRVALFGDSFVEGLGAPDGETISDLLASLALSAGKRVEFMNFGAGGFGLLEYSILLRDAARIFRPDHTLLVLYANDFYEIPEVADLL